MMSVGPLTRLHRMERERRKLLLRAAALLTAASACVAILPFRSAIRFGSVPVEQGRRRNIDDVIWAVEAAASRLPWRTVCIEKGLVAQRMLRSSGVDAILHYGARHRPEGGRLEAHVWVTVDDQAVIGGEEAAGFARVATYP